MVAAQVKLPPMSLTIFRIATRGNISLGRDGFPAMDVARVSHRYNNGRAKSLRVGNINGGSLKDELSGCEKQTVGVGVLQ
jgi:hypothetical protein